MCSEARFFLFTLTSSPQALEERLRRDIEDGKRKPDVLERSLKRLPLYEEMDSRKIDVSVLSPRKAAELLAERLGSQL